MKIAKLAPHTWAPLAGGGLFYLLFYQQGMGLNVALYGATLLLMAWLTQPHLRLNEWAQLAGLAFAISLTAFLVWDSDMAFLTCLFALPVFLGSLYQSPLPSVGKALWRGGYRLFNQAAQLALRSLATLAKPVARRLSLRASTAGYLLVVPVLLLFLALFQGASPVFEQSVKTGMNWLASLMSWRWAGEVLLFLAISAIGMWLSYAVLAPARPERLLPWERQRPGQTSFLLGNTKGEGRIFQALLIGINLLLAMYNMIDIEWIWFNFQMPEGVPMSQLVHQGTYFLIFSILLSSGLLLIIFRNSQEYFSLATYWLAKAWLMQNALLVVSVLIRNYRYIDEYGLAYKRIGVLFFLALTLVGLFALHKKIMGNLKFAYLFRVNGFAAGALWLLTSLVDWDGVILDYNLSKIKPGEFDTYFHIHLSVHQLPKVIQHMDEIVHDDYYHNSTDYRGMIKTKMESFFHDFEHSEWPSKTPRDYISYRALRAWQFKLSDVAPYTPPSFD